MAVSVPLARQEAPSLRSFLELDLLDNRYPALHGMRVLGIVSVVQWHVSQLLVSDRNLAIDAAWSQTSFSVFFGMDLFFVLSGFLIGSILLRSVESSGWRSIRRFYLRRAFRTFPSYYLVLSFLVLTTPLTAVQRHNVPFEFSYLTNYASNGRENVVMPWGWSLGLEEQFYLTVPLLFILLHKLRGDRARLALLAALWCSAPLMRLYTYLHYGDGIPAAQFDTIYFRTHTRSDTLIAGLILAYVHARWKAPIARWLESPFSRAILALPPLLCLWILLHPLLFAARPRLGEILFWGTFTSIMYVGWGLLVLHGGDGWIRRALSAPVLRRIATLGYGVYLVHIPVCDKLVAPGAVALLKHWHWSSEAVWVFTLVAALIGSIGLSYVLHVVVEKPSLRLRDRLAG